MKKDYYTGWQARYYNLLWGTFTKRTLMAAETMIDVATLQTLPHRLRRRPRVLDVGCGTGVLLKWLLAHIAELDAYGIDASAAMLAQAALALKEWPHVQLEQRKLSTEATAGFPYAPGTFDLITCTNTLHYLSDPVATLAELGQLLAPGGQLVVEDYARREPPFPWTAFTWLVRRVDPGHVRAYTLAEAKSLCRQAGLLVVYERSFAVDWLWHGWALRACIADRQG